MKFKADTIQTLDLKIETLENDFKRDLQLAKDKLGSHTKCKKEIESLREMLDQKEKQVDKLTDDLIQQTEEMQRKLDKVLEEKQKELEENEIKFQEEKELLQKEVQFHSSFLLSYLILKVTYSKNNPPNRNHFLKIKVMLLRNGTLI